MGFGLGLGFWAKVRPWVTSALSFFAFSSGVSLFVKPKGSHRVSGDGCTLALVTVRVRVGLGLGLGLGWGVGWG